MIVLKNIQVDILGEPLFEKVNMVIRSGDRIGIVGPNGSGKTTFMRLLASLVEADEGSLRIEQERIGYLPQDIAYEEGETVETFMASTPVSVRGKVLKEVGLAKVDMETLVAELSGGQKRRLALARVLGGGPTFLLLDEPTNHLDRETVGWLQDFIKGFRGGVVLISHDRSLLNSVVHKILEIDPRTQTIIEYKGNYRTYVEARDKRDALQFDAYERQQKEKKRLEAWLALKRQDAAIHAAPNKGKTIRAKAKYLQREILDKEVVRPDARKKIKVAQLDGEVAEGKLVCRFESVSKVFGDTPILANASFEIRGRERVLLLGNNGTGKTTLLKMLVGETEQDSGTIKIGEAVSVGYFSQEQESLNKNNTVLEELENTPDLLMGDSARAVLGGFLFTGDDVFKLVSDLSLGERVRLIFAKLTNQRHELLVLDEPTNHLDIPSREVIEAALQEFEGAILAVSHDQFFVDALGFNRKLQIQKGAVEEVS